MKYIKYAVLALALVAPVAAYADNSCDCPCRCQKNGSGKGDGKGDAKGGK